MKMLLMIIGLSLLYATLAFAQTSYPMTCVFDGSQNVSITPSLTAARKLVVSFSFKRATKPATQGVDPGTCAWQDRGLYADEPTIMAHVVDDAYTYQDVVFAGKSQLVLAPISAPWAPQSKNRGYTLNVKVYNSAPDHGIAVKFFRITN